MTAVSDLRGILAEVTDLTRVAELLIWDQETYMPPGGVSGRASQAATVSRLAHERFVSAEVGRLLERAEAETQSLDYDSDDRSLVRVARREYDQEAKLPSDLVAAMARAMSESQPVWAEARERSDWSLFAPRMQVTVDLARRVADAYGYTREPMEALISRHEPGLGVDDVESLFEQLRAAIVPLVGEITSREGGGDGALDRRLEPSDRLLSVALDVVGRLGYDLNRGRQDLSRHPFTVTFGPGDVRITTRVEDGLTTIFSSIHEAGHAMYEQGVAPALDGTPLCAGATPGVHESQSRLWENLVGRSLPFWRYFLPHLRVAFPDALGSASEDQLYRGVNRVRPGYIRVDADEVTYNLHIMLRTELERELLSGGLPVADVPEVWNEKLREYLGLDPPPDAEGCLQDMHWTHPLLGGFVGYTLGNVIGAQLMVTIRESLPDLDEQLAAGEFGRLLEWLRSHLYEHGRKFTPNELLERATGRPVTAEPWIAYVRRKFGELYGVPV
ncbi:MAG: carboxypeptidase M32 [Candidatus Dormibacteraeota bacterium]|nr:carboxypeptidase M32 [Candidatus Dormibacteraeota bacterium]MBO0762559.1 carboxypeptidase M32 [Candidatus Dormibacteraeota bacterium]